MGIPGYELKLWNHDVQKPIVYGIHKQIKARHFLDDILRQKKIVPPPNQYTVAKDFTIKANAIVNKSPRITLAGSIENQAKKDKYPAPDHYKINRKQVSTEGRTLGCFNFKSDRSGFLDECQLIGKEVHQPYFDKNWKSVDKKLKVPNIYKPVPPKPEKKTSLSPASYNANDSFKNGTLAKPKFYISKYKYENFMAAHIKNNGYKKGPSQYDTTKAQAIITKGAAKGWK